MNDNLWYKVTTKQNSSSKRVQLLQDDARGAEELPCQKRRMLNLMEHQKEVRRTQQGRERDCGGHGPGIRTYTGALIRLSRKPGYSESRIDPGFASQNWSTMKIIPLYTNDVCWHAQP
ncbi:hypothetical protein Droror1_Dr00023862 [Drosera rotundifolia]